MNSETVLLIERIRQGFYLASARNNKADTATNYDHTDITQYNISVDGKIVQTIVFDMKEFKFKEHSVDDYDVEITISDNDVIPVFHSETMLQDLYQQVSILCFFFLFI